MVGPLRPLCAALPLAIRQPPQGSALNALCEKADQEPWPTTWAGYIEMARGIVNRRPSVASPPFYREMAYVGAVLRCATELVQLRRWARAERNKPGRHEGFALYLAVDQFLSCGGRLGPGDHSRAHARAAELLGPGLTPDDVEKAVSIYTAATSQQMHDAAYRGRGEQPAALFSASLAAVRDFATKHHSLLDHSHDAARRAAEEDAEFDRRYQPLFGDIG